MTSRRTWTAALVALLLLPRATSPQSPVFSFNPVMVKGAPEARVTIVEFSDYQ